MIDKPIARNAARTRQVARKAGITIDYGPEPASLVDYDEQEQPDIM